MGHLTGAEHEPVSYTALWQVCQVVCTGHLDFTAEFHYSISSLFLFFIKRMIFLFHVSCIMFLHLLQESSREGNLFY